MGASIYPWEFCISMHFSMLGELKDHKTRRGLVVSEMPATRFWTEKNNIEAWESMRKWKVDNSWEIKFCIPNVSCHSLRKKQAATNCVAFQVNSYLESCGGSVQCIDAGSKGRASTGEFLIP